jgi:hypothetical protein
MTSVSALLATLLIAWFFRRHAKSTFKFHLKVDARGEYTPPEQDVPDPN